MTTKSSNTITPTLFGSQSIKGAEFSSCGKYRYALWRIWDEQKPVVMCIGLNPSTANSGQNDPTITFLIKMLTMMGYGGFYMMNLFAFITSKPKELKKEKDVLGDNNKWLSIISPKCTDVVFCWGGFTVLSLYKEFEDRVEFMKEMFPKALCFGWTSSSQPFHPLAMMYSGKCNNPELFNFSSGEKIKPGRVIKM